MPKPRRPTAYYVDLGVRAIAELVDQEGAAVWSEVEAKIADAIWGDLPHIIEPHHLTTARQALLETGYLLQVTEPTRGKRPIEVFVPADSHRRLRLIAAASARKRLLQARFLGWATGTKTEPALIGAAGESVVHASIRAAAPHAGLALINPERGEVRRLFGEPVPGGPLDNGATVPIIVEDMPVGVATVVVEVKNLRDWLYPNSHQVYQLLFKAASLQLTHPQMRFLPVLVCRRANYTLYEMAQDLGFIVFVTGRQFIVPKPDRDPRFLDEVRTELGYADLTEWIGADEALTGRFAKVLPSVIEQYSARWSEVGSLLVDYFTILRRDTPQPGRSRDMDAVRFAVKQAGAVGDW